MPLLIHIATVPEFFESFFRGQLDFMNAQGFEIGLICSPDERAQAFERWPVRYYPVHMERRISPLADMVSIWKIVGILRSIRPDIVHVHTSKAGLLGMVAAWIAGVRVRVFTIHGFRWVTKKGVSRWLIQQSNRLTSRLAHQVFCVSRSNLALGIEKGICPPKHTKLLGRGSINGVDAEGRFNPGNRSNRESIRTQLRIPVDAFVFGFVGRIVRDKGIAELADAWRMIRNDFEDAHLMLVGKMERGDPVPEHAISILKGDKRVHWTGYCPEVAPYYEAMDAFVLPSYREGFPVTPLEASAMGLPVIVSDVRGCTDAVVDGKTGVLILPRNSTALEKAMRSLLKDREEALRLGAEGRKFVSKHFQPGAIHEALAKTYTKLLKRHPSRQTGLPLFIKRMMDILMVIPGLMLFSPLMVIGAMVIRRHLGSPIIYRDRRIGKKGDPFWFYKFRTMTDERDGQGNLLPDEKRLTTVGRFFRAASLDELPQLINVFKGEMSFIGPRPLPVRYQERFTPRQAMRHAVMPGVTGLTAVSYRGNARTWEEKFEDDVWYVEHWCLLLDVKIMLKTFWVVVKKGVLNRAGETTSGEFLGGHKTEDG